MIFADLACIASHQIVETHDSIDLDKIALTKISRGDSMNSLRGSQAFISTYAMQPKGDAEITENTHKWDRNTKTADGITNFQNNYGSSRMSCRCNLQQESRRSASVVCNCMLLR